MDTVLTPWLTAEAPRVGDARAIDGKSLRGSAQGARPRPVHLLAALIHRTGPVAGQVRVETKTHEIPKCPDRLDPLDVTGRGVTVEARPSTTPARPSRPRIVPPPVRTVDRGHGRMDTRVIRTSTALNLDLNWPGLAQVFRIDRPVTTLDGRHPRGDPVCGLTDLTPAADAATLGAYVRHHGGIKTRLHDIRDMTFDEDRSQVRTHNRPRVMATLRHTAIGLLRTCGVTNIPRAVNHLGRHPDPVVRLLRG